MPLRFCRCAIVAALMAALVSGCGKTADSGDAIVIARQGAFPVGGTILGDPLGSSLHCDHGVVEYQIPPNPRPVNLLMWHSASTVAWQQRWDGGEGFQSIFLRRGFPVYLWDGPRVGRANWGCADTTFAAELGRDQRNFIAWRFGLEYPHWFDGVQFPTEDPEAWNAATRGRYQEFDSVENAELQADAAALEQSKLFVEVIKKYGGDAELLMLRDAGLVGNTHIPFADMNNVEVADLLSEFLNAHSLD